MSSVSLIEDVINGRLPLAVYRSNRGWSDIPPPNAIVLAGSFRPLHRGHRSLLESALTVLNEPLIPCFEISITNVEKSDIATSDLNARLEQFDQPDDTVVITRAATFVEKARLMTGTTFAIGYDTAVRLFDDRFYADAVASSQTADAMEEIRNLDCRFVVGGRHDQNGRFRTVRDLEIPKGFESLLTEIPEAVFADPISSTEIRRSGEFVSVAELTIKD